MGTLIRRGEAVVFKYTKEEEDKIKKELLKEKLITLAFDVIKDLLETNDSPKGRNFLTTLEKYKKCLN